MKTGKKNTNWKKLVAVLMALVTMFAMAGCGSSSDSGDDSSESAETLKVAISPDFAPMEFVDTSKSGQDQYVGFDVTLAKYIAENMGMELEILPMDFSACQAAVQSGKADISISGYSYTEERAENFELSDYYYAGDNETKQTIIVNKENEGKFSTADDFAGLTVGAQTASLQMNFCTSQLPDTVTIKEFSDLGTAVEALRSGNIDAVAVAEGNAKAIMANNDEVALSGFYFEVAAEEENNVILIQKGNTELLEQVNAILAQAYEQGLYSGWYTDAQELAGIDTAAEISYDEEGNEITDESSEG